MANYAKKHDVKAVIHTAASSSLGRMMVRYFKKEGIKLINVVRKDQYIDELKAEGADYVLNSTSDKFEEELAEIAQKEEATLCFEAVAGSFSGTILKAMPYKSTLLVYGFLSSSKVEVDISELVWKKKTV